MKITRKKQRFTSTFFLNNTELEEVDEFRDLGVITDHLLRWNSHVNCVNAKANRMLGLIKRTCKGLNDLKTLRTLYCSLVRSNLEYCSVVWSPYSRTKEHWQAWGSPDTSRGRQLGCRGLHDACLITFRVRVDGQIRFEYATCGWENFF